MNEPKRNEDKDVRDRKLHLLSKELEDATNAFLLKIAQLEKLLPEVNE
jgi:hypothetical protein